jgi:hypothetical protein
MRIERVIDGLARELAAKAGKDWAKLTPTEKEQFRAQAESMADEVTKRLGDVQRKYAE